MHPLATASQSSAPGAWAYLVVFAAAAVGYMGVPIIGTAVITGAAVLASQGELNIAAVLIVAAIGNEVGGLLGYQIGDRWGRQLLEHPGPALKMRADQPGHLHRRALLPGRGAAAPARTHRGHQRCVDDAGS